MRILTVCEHGNVRSVAMAYLIKTIYHHKHEVLAVGVKDVSKQTFEYLANRWADKVIVMDKSLFTNNSLQRIKHIQRRGKFFLADVGEDIWHDANNEELRHECLKYIKDLNL